MDFHILLEEASNHLRYQKQLLDHMIFPEPCAKYAFTLHAITKSRFHYPYGISLNSLPCHAFLYTFSGCAKLCTGQHEHALTKDTTAWFDCSHGFTIELPKSNEDWDFILIFASGESLPDYYGDFTENGDITIFSQHSPAIAATFRQIYSNAISGQDGNFLIFPKLLCDLITYLTLDRSIRNRYGEEPEHIIQIINYIREHYTEKITLDSLSSHFALSKYSLSRSFTYYMNQSLIDYLIDFRVDESKKLLQFTDHSIAEIADETGFSTINNFIAQFKKRTDLTPTAYRRQNQIYSSKQRLYDHYET
ncbi:MAG: helix-turn-helix transcriptional regulator [Lachnospiraceae bacterium]|nr:helix-turn-helix transcriptional regulator [Lachnospiraceae bacterium]